MELSNPERIWRLACLWDIRVKFSQEGIPARQFSDQYLETLAVYRKIVQQTHKSGTPASARKTMELIDGRMDAVDVAIERRKKLSTVPDFPS